MKEHFNGKVRLVVESQHEVASGWRTKKANVLSERNYDTEGRLIEERFRRRRHINRITYDYNRNGHCVERREYDADRVQFFRYKFKYDRWGNQIEEQSFALDGSLASTSTSKFTSEGQETEKRLRRGESSEQIRYKYDPQGNLLEEEKLNNGKFERRRIYQYDDHGNKIEETFFNQEGEIVSQQISYKYDEQGRITEQRVSERSSGTYRRYTFLYDAEGRLLRRNQFDDTGNFSGANIYYDRQGRKEEERWYNSESHSSGRTVFTYDAFGNIIEESIYQGSFEAREQELSVVKGAVTQRLEYHSINEFLRFQSKHTFDENGIKLTTTETQFDSNGQTTQFRHRIFTPEGQILEEVIDNNTTKYIYDEQCNWITRETYKDNILTEVVTREISYYT